MVTDPDPLFANTCGKIFNGHIVLASSNKESEYPVDNLKKLTLRKRYATGSIVFTFLPGILLLVPYFSNGEEAIVKILFIGMGLAGLAIAVSKIKKRYLLHIETVTGSNSAISVWEGNKNDAQKFADRVNRLIAIQQNA